MLPWSGRKAAFLLWLWVLVVAALAASSGDGRKAKRDDPGSLPNLDLDLDAFYYETALTHSESTLLASTLDGHLVALSQETGELLWDIREEPVVKSPYDSAKPVLPAFLPDPKDGSIYMIGGGLKDPLKKLPFTIPELVAASPCKSSDGILYTGKKVDTWISVDRYTGDRQGTISFNGCLEGANDQCPNFRPANVLIGRTEYNIMMYDSRAGSDGRRWNISFFDYSSNLAGVDVGPDYELAHFTDSSSGSLVTLDRTTGGIQWEKEIGSPIVALYRLEDDGIVSVPFTSVSKETLGNLLNQFTGDAAESKELIGETKLYPTLYVGEHEHGLYAMPSLVDQQTLTIAPSSTGPLLLEGPQNFQVPSEINLDVISDKESARVRGFGSADAGGVDPDDPLGIPIGAADDHEGREKSSVLLFGYYQVPEHSTIKLSPAVSHLQLTSGSSHHHRASGAGQLNQHRMRMRGGRHHHFGGGGGHPPPPLHETVPGGGGFAPGVSERADENGIVSNVYPSPGRLPLPPHHRVSDQAAEHGLTPNGEINVGGRSYSSAYYYYEYTPRGERGEDGEGEEEHSYDLAVVAEGLRQIRQLNTTFVASWDLVRFAKELVPMVRESVLRMENKELKAIVVLLFVLVIAVFMFYWRVLSTTDLSPSGRVRRFYSGNSRSSANGSSVGNLGGSFFSDVATAHALELEDGTVRVGSIYFDPAQILGKGCEGTFVFKGRFDNRDVAVKRVLNAEVGVADREVDLLRESDEHPNVIRYFCMEQDRQFRYIALEFCQATLQDFVDGRYVNPKLDAVTMLRQATQGLLHLHTLEIVHRDIKPQNVLISMPGRRGDVRAMISDFGLCKKLKVGRMSFSRRSGVAGTEGWIAPEMMDDGDGRRSNTCAVDIFSLGCVYYFVLSRGHHPFGDAFHRQGNIQCGKCDLSKLEDQLTARSLVERMVQREQADRPTTQAVLRHPLFWSREKVLAFLQDVSDRVDKEDADSALVEALERGRPEVVRGNWHEWLDAVVREDLRRHRTYNGRQVRDLLRALRNKKHHYNELPEETKAMYGRIPDQFVDYWTSRFPRLLVHSWHAMHSVKSEPTFQKYFDKDYDFLQPPPVASGDRDLEDARFHECQKPSSEEEATHYRPTMTFVPESRRRHHHQIPPPPEQPLFEPQFMKREGKEGDGEDQRQFFPATNGGGGGGGGDQHHHHNDESASISSTVSKWEDIDSGRIDRIAGFAAGDPAGSEAPVTNGRVAKAPTVVEEEKEEAEEEFHEMPPASQEIIDRSNDSPLLLVTNNVQNQQQQQQQQQQQLPHGSPKKRNRIVQLSSDAKQEELADLERKRAANKPSWSEAVRNITADDKLSMLETTREEEEGEGEGEGGEEEEEENVQPKWVVDERVQAEAKKKKNNKKKKKRPPAKAT